MWQRRPDRRSRRRNRVMHTLDIHLGRLQVRSYLWISALWHTIGISNDGVAQGWLLDRRKFFKLPAHESQRKQK